MRYLRLFWIAPFVFILALRGYASSVAQEAPARAAAQVAPLEPGQLLRSETEHYVFESDSAREVHAEHAKVIEACWAPLKEFFGAEPKLKKSERLKVFFFEAEDRWAEKIKSDGTNAPLGAGGYYWPPTKTAYLWRQPSVYFTRQLLIHEVIHQFHFLGCCNNTGPKDIWYIEGIAEYLSRHFWDGEKLTLGALPVLSLEDYSEKALELFAAKDFDFKGFAFSDRASSRPEQWAFVRYLQNAEQGKFKKQWSQIAKRLDRGESAKNIFRSVFGDPKSLGDKVHEWLKTEQEPCKPVFNEWEGIAPGRIKGWASVTSACRTRGEVTRLDAALQVPEGPYIGGLLLHWANNDDYTVALIKSSGSVHVNRRVKDSWQVLFTGPAPKAADPKVYRLAAQRLESGVEFIIENQSYGPFDLPAGPLGLCLENCKLTFHDVTWK